MKQVLSLIFLFLVTVSCNESGNKSKKNNNSPINVTGQNPEQKINSEKELKDIRSEVNKDSRFEVTPEDLEYLKDEQVISESELKELENIL